MKKITLFAVIIALALSSLPASFASQKPQCPVPLGGFALGGSSAKSIWQTVTIDPTKIMLFQDKLMLEGFTLTNDIGKPQIPFSPMRLSVPNGFRATGVRLADCSFTKKALPELANYSPKTWRPDQIPELQQNKPAGVYPPDLGSFKSESGMKGNYATLNIFPISLDYENKLMNVATKLVFQIELEPEMTVKNIGEDGAENKALILTTSKFKSQAERLAKSQKGAGYSVEIVDIETLKGAYQPQKEEPKDRGPKSFSKSDKEYMKNYDYSFVKTIRAYLLTRVDDISYITILGDGSAVPPSFYYMNYSYMKVDKYVPSDIYYASPDLDYVPNFALGRLPARTPQEADSMISKIEDYRKSLSADWFHSIDFCGGDPFNGGFEGELACQSVIDQGLVDNFKIKKYYKTSKLFDTDTMKKAFSEDVGFIYVDSHGSGDAIIAEPGEINTDDVMALPKRSKLPILVSVACLNGMYDADLVNYKFEKYPNSKGLSFGQACMVSPGGPIAYFGGSRLNYAGVNWGVESGVVKIQPFTEIDRCAQEVINAYHNWAGSLGEITVNAFTKYVGLDTGWSTSDKTTYCYVFFGDPTIKLPATPEGTPHRMPEVDFKGCPMSKGRTSIPLLSYIDSNTINVKTDLKSLSMRIFDLDEEAKIVDKGDFKKVSDNLFTISYKPSTKKVWHGRIDMPNNSEAWFYYYAGANTDVSLVNKTVFYTQKPGQRTRFSLEINNDGIKKVSNVQVTFFLDDKPVETRKIKSLEMFEYDEMSFFLDGMENSKHKIKFEAKSDEKEQYPQDNSFSKDLIITDSDTAKTGIMVSYLFPGEQAKKLFNIDKYNDMVKTMGSAPAEMATIGSDSYFDILFGTRYENFKNQGVDTLFMVTPGFGNPSNPTLIKALTDFQASGGTIIGFGCLGSSTNGSVYSTISDIFGLSGQVDYDYSEIPQAQMSIENKSHPIFANLGVDKFTIKASGANVPPKKSWTENLTGAQILAKSDDGSQIIASNSKNLYFSLAPKFETEADMKLLYNISTYNLRPQPDASITLDGMNSEPGRISIGQPAKLSVTVKNVGNVDISNIDVKVDQLDKTQKIEKIARSKEAVVAFDIPAQAKTGVLEYTATVTCDGDVNPADNKSTLRVRVYETKVDQTENIVTNLSIRDGLVLANKPFILTGKTQPNSIVTVYGRVTRSDSSGRFSLYLTPGATPITISVKKSDGSLSKTDVWCSFAPVQSIGGAIDSKTIFTDKGYTDKLDYTPVLTKDQTNYVDLTHCAGALGLDFSNENGSFAFGKGQFRIIGKTGSDKATVSIAAFSKEISLDKPAIDQSGSILIPFTALIDLGFGGDIHADSKTYLLTFPKNVDIEPAKPYQSTMDGSKQSNTGFPSEADYGRPTLLSYGPTDGEIEQITEYNVGENITVWTTRGIEVWSKDGKFIRCLGFPKTASKDLEIDWDYLFRSYSDSSYGSQSFLVLPDGGIILKFGSHICFYDSSWNFIKTVSFLDSGLNSNIPLQFTSDGNVIFVDWDGVAYVYDTKGNKISQLKFYDSENSLITSINTLQVTKNGNLLVFTCEYNWFSVSNWALRVYSKDAKLLKEKVVKPEETSDAGEETESEKYEIPPSFVVGDIDQTYWTIADNYDGVLINHLDSEFAKIETIKFDRGGLVARGGFAGFKIDSSGKFWSRGIMQIDPKKPEDITLLATCGHDFKFQPSINRVFQNREQIFPDDMIFDREGNLLVYNRYHIARYSPLGNKIDNIKFKLPKGEDFIDFAYVIKNDGKYTTGIVEGEESYDMMIADENYNIIRLVPLIVEEPIPISNYTTNLEKNEIYITDRSSNPVVKVISAHLDDEKDPDSAEIIHQFGSRGYGQGKITTVSEIETYGDRVYILDSIQSKVIVFKTDGTFLFEFGGYGTTPGKMANPIQMFIDNKGFIWLFDWQNSTIAVFDSEGTYITNLGHEGMYTTPSSVEACIQTPFELLHPYCMAVSDGKIAIFEYAHARLFILSALDTTTGMIISPENPVLEGYKTQSTLSTWFTVTNSGSGNLDAKISCKAENVTIKGGEVKNNAGLVEVSIDLTKGEVPKSITLDVESTIGTGTITIPLILKNIEFSFALGSMIAKGSDSLMRLSRAPAKIDSAMVFSTKDLAELMPIDGIIAKDNSTVSYQIGNRRLGFEAGKTTATLQIGDDTFKVDLGMKTEKTKDGGLTVPIEVIAAFASCQIVEEKGYFVVVTRK